MSNRRKLRSRKGKHSKSNPNGPTIITPSGQRKIELPREEKVVLKTVPAKAGDEIIGTCIIYEDGTMDLAVNADISDKAKQALYDFKTEMVDFMPTDEEVEDGSARQEQAASNTD